GGDRSFDLYIDDQHVLTFTTHHSSKPATWESEGVDGVKLVFEFSKADRHGDAHGFAHLRVPLKFIKPGRPMRLKVVGHAQDSPDWFMTFRYTFEEKVEVEVLPFLLNRLGHPERAMRFTVMHFGQPTTLAVLFQGGLKAKTYPINNGLNVIEDALSYLDDTTTIRFRGSLGIHQFDTTLILHPIIHHDIHLVHHSHTDIGYSHMLAEV
ncbi:MAG: hypothetical protein ACK46C_13455, partial [Flavobacteriales bacterium]